MYYNKKGKVQAQGVLQKEKKRATAEAEKQRKYRQAASAKNQIAAR
jgi:hypothetical protein